MTMTKPYRGAHFGSGYAAEYIPLGQRGWRILKQAGQVVIHATREAAERAAEAAFWSSDKSRSLVNLPVDESGLEAAMKAKAEDWLEQRRADRKASATLHRPGKRPLVVETGRAVR